MNERIAQLYDRYCPPELPLDFGAIDELPVRLQPAPTWRSVQQPSAYVAKMLLSYHYFKRKSMDELFAAINGPTWAFIDCGAFSASTQGAHIDIEQYAAWCLANAEHFFVVSSLDSIGDPVVTLRNQRIMESLGVDALPVFHIGEDWRYLEAYCEQYAYVALGGMVGYKGDVNNFLARSFAIGERHSTVFHGFGQTRPEQLRLFPFFSVDSSSWGMGHRFGQLDVWDDAHHTLRSLTFKEAMQPANAGLVRAHGVEPDRFHPDNYHANYAASLNAVAWSQYADHVATLHGPVHIRDGSRPPGLHMFLVDGASSNLIPAMNHIHHVLGGHQ